MRVDLSFKENIHSEDRALRKKFWLAILLTVIFIWFVNLHATVPAGAQPLKHTVQRGDTLWDICKKYYGDEELWPKLWQMNPFITNPHLLKPGDVITLLEGVPVKESAIKEIEKTPPKASAPAFAYGKTGLDISGFTDVKSIGFLSTKEVEPWGRILSGEEKKVVLSEGDKIYVSMKREREINPGDLFTIYRDSRMLKHPLERKRLGYVISFLGRVRIKEKVKETTEESQKNREVDQESELYKAEIIESYRAAQVGDPVLSYEPISPCIEPMPMERELTTNVVAVKDLREIAGQFTVVYLPYGYNEGIRRGNLFEILEKREVESPKKRMLPDLVIGHAVVMEARPDTATGVVIDTRGEFPNGAYLKGVDWMSAQGVLSLLPECPLQ